MSNVKDFNIEARVAFNWLDSVHAEDAGLLARWFLSPSINLQMSFTPDGMEPNSHGGRTAMYRLRITGQEAIAWGGVERLIQVLNRYGKVLVRDVVDIEEAG